ncbi:unnamed protein product [Euphydryas editha]|uniref:Uncharacterized protein n=1 Tax=Euphydryas editha TaxID=104508 RepID=A0AAU9U3U9_EUPED|nr:unnamed protein product [Euphydryas editha]
MRYELLAFPNEAFLSKSKKRPPFYKISTQFAQFDPHLRLSRCFICNKACTTTWTRIPVPTNTKNFELPSLQNSEHSDLPSSGEIFNPRNEPCPLNQQELNHLVQDLGLAKDAAERIGSPLKENNLLDAR